MENTPSEIVAVRGGRGARGDVFVISLDDEASGCRIATVTMSAEEFAQAITGRAAKCSVTWTDVDKIGKRREMKEVQILFPTYKVSAPPTKEERAAALEPFEVDGWKGEPSDLGNPRKRDMVTFVRWVSP